MRANKYILIIFGLLSVPGFALTNTPATPLDGTSESKMSVTDVAPTKNKVDGDIDNEITNPKIRADSGSKSKFSASTTMSYKGGAISRPFGAERPNLSGLPETQIDSSIDGSMKMRYRSSKNRSFTVGVALGIKTPFQGDVNQNNNQTSVGDPLIGHNYTFAGLGLQNSWNVAASAGTSQESLRNDQAASLATDYTLMKVFDRVHVGLSASGWHNFYDSNPGENKGTRMTSTSGHSVDKRPDWAMTLYPTVEYYVNDRVALRTLFGYFRWNHLYGDRDNWSLLRSKEYQSIGMGLTVTRDIYVYPNVQFLPRDIRSQYTNFGVQTTINVF